MSPLHAETHTGMLSLSDSFLRQKSIVDSIARMMRILASCSKLSAEAKGTEHGSFGVPFPYLDLGLGFRALILGEYSPFC